MEFEPALIEVTLLRRYKRFLADVRTPDGREFTAHCPNTGSMMGCMEPGSRVWLSHSPDPKRKYAHTWQLVEAEGALVGINTGLSNRLVEEAIGSGLIAELAGWPGLRREVRYGDQGSRIDLLLEDGERRCYVEVKNVTAAVSEGVAIFPDAVSARGSKHLEELMLMVREGHQAALVFCVQRGDVHTVRPADAIDPLYGQRLREAAQAGVRVLACGARVWPGGVVLERVLDVDLSRAG
ncbi:DNA/RNA nuclease SfsA [Thioalkalivibrio sulfidiphilus]|uniref:Sugar fermentation stimulation protein homolog n=1 Tax=Thioalkalivibrio sulfidiphilus (strain HL-EbGR7) TaxID=396588 RepID=SFSA_THISH|nr:DNA/RNA nuclease SfsA [Thioalkalivibrio sulfidiphilus]B8GR29.1 RecName: Full=Sugar fermentation stimulation protein homolog [Thioalkalivibrio sulfidiphilus HL-EbGr7]ACL72449.1 sugar fermentation stimulation protein [Thioalkalivibrio sulfidiphilus HL-EbGr7]